MKLITNPPAVLALLMVATVVVVDNTAAFTPSNKHSSPSSESSLLIGAKGSLSTIAATPAPNFNQRSRRRRLFQDAISRTTTTSTTSTALNMAAEDFNEAKYTETAWSSISALTKVADYYQSSNVEAPFLLDVMLNPSKHNAGENSEAATKVVEKALNKAGVNVKDLRSELESYLSRQVRVSDNSQKAMGRTLQKVLETARIGQSVLGVSLKECLDVSCVIPMLNHDPFFA